MSAERFFVLGATHQDAPIAVREKLALTAEAESALQAELAASGAVAESAVLSTCNRIEIYGVGADGAALAAVEDRLCRRAGFALEAFAAIRLRLEGLEAIRHLFEVAAGADSQIVGETEIFGQVKDAYASAAARGFAGPILNRIFQKAFQAAKHVRTHTAISAGQVSVANVAVDLAQNIFGDLRPLRVLLIGAGEIGEKAARALQSRGASMLTLCSRSLERTLALAEALGAGTLPFEHREARLADFDIVVCATSAPHAVLAAAAIGAAVRRRTGRPLLLLDLALPRDIEPDAASLASVFLYNLDDLAAIAHENRLARAAERERCRLLLAERAQYLWRDLGHRATSRPEQRSSLLRGRDPAPQADHPS